MAKRFLGIQYPLVKSARGLLAQRSGVDQIKADLLQLLLTNPGERVMLPTYGTNLRSLIFEPNDPQLEMDARKMVLDSIENWEPRIVVQDVQVTSQFPSDHLGAGDPGEDAGHILGITITFYDSQDISQVNELKLELPMGGSG